MVNVNQPLLARIAELQKMYREMGDVAKLHPERRAEAEDKRLRIAIAIKRLEWLVQKNYDNAKAKQ